MSQGGGIENGTLGGFPALPEGLEADAVPPHPLRGVLLAPTGLLRGAAAESALAAGHAAPLAGGPVAFSAAMLFLRRHSDAPWAVHGAELATLQRWAARQGPTLQAILSAALARLSAPRAAFAGLPLDRTRIMGIVNCTPDSFSDGGDAFRADDAVTAGLSMLQAGADLIDVGGESTRPGADPVSPEEELRRVLPVVRALADRGARVSIDTRRASVMEAALSHGASVVNDVTALTHDPEALHVVTRQRAPVILMHMQGEPSTMQVNPTYDRAAADVYGWLASRVAICQANGIPPERLCVDPGIGFGKTLAHNLDLMAHLALFHGLGCAVLMGASRKSLIARATGRVDATGRPMDDPKDRLGGSLAAALAAAAQGVHFVRVHDVAETAQALRLCEAIADATGRAGGPDDAP